MPHLTDSLLETSQILEAVRRGSWELLNKLPYQTSGTVRLATEAHDLAETGAMMVVRQIVAANSSIRPYQGDTYATMAKNHAEISSDLLAAAWAMVDRTPYQELSADVLNILVKRDLFSVNDGRYLEDVDGKRVARDADSILKELLDHLI